MFARRGNSAVNRRRNRHLNDRTGSFGVSGDHDKDGEEYEDEKGVGTRKRIESTDQELTDTVKEYGCS